MVRHLDWMLDQDLPREVEVVRSDLLDLSLDLLDLFLDLLGVYLSLDLLDVLHELLGVLQEGKLLSLLLLRVPRLLLLRVPPQLPSVLLRPDLMIGFLFLMGFALQPGIILNLHNFLLRPMQRNP